MRTSTLREGLDGTPSPRFLPLEPHSKSFHCSPLHPSFLSLRWFLHGRVGAQVFGKSPARCLNRCGNRQLVVPWFGDWETENRIQIENFLCWSCEKSQRSSGSARWSRDRQAQYLYESARCLRGLVKLPSRRAAAVSTVDLFLGVLSDPALPRSGKFQNLRCLRAWPHSVIHDIRCEPARKWLADELTVVGVPPKRCSKNLSRVEFQGRSQPRGRP